MTICWPLSPSRCFRPRLGASHRVLCELLWCESRRGERACRGAGASARPRKKRASAESDALADGDHARAPQKKRRSSAPFSPDALEGPAAPLAAAASQVKAELSAAAPPAAAATAAAAAREGPREPTPFKEVNEWDDVVLAGPAMKRIEHDKRTEYEAIVAAFQKSQAGDGVWIQTIPINANLTLKDVHLAQSGEAEIHVVAPQTYEQVTVLKHDHHMFWMGRTPEQQQESRTLDYGYFSSDPYQKQSANPYERFRKFNAGYQSKHFPKYNAAADNHWAVAGSGSDVWYKVTPSLLEHARNT